MINSLSYQFDSTDIEVSGLDYYVDITHNLNTTDYFISLIDNNNQIRNTSNIFTIGLNVLRIYMPNANIVGVWHVNIYYNDSINIDGTKKLFEQPLVNANQLSQYINYRFAFNTTNGQTKNITLSTLKDMLQTSLDSSLYLNRSNNLSDLPNKETARTNLDVYSKTEVDSCISAMYPINGYIESISNFTPSAGLSNVPTVNIYKTFEGFEVNINANLTNTEGHTQNGINIGYFIITPIAENTLTFTDTYGGLFCSNGTSNFNTGQTALKFETEPNNTIKCSVLLWCPRPSFFTSGVANCVSTIKCPIISHSNNNI